MLKFFKEWRNRKDLNLICYHQINTNYIYSIVLCTWIIALSLVINFFHLPIHLYGIEIERFEFGLIVAFVLINIVNFKLLLVTVFFLPFLDQLFHGHNILLVPFEAIFNSLAFSFVYLLWNLFSKKKGFFSRIIFIFFSLLFFLVLKILYFILVLSLFVPQINFFNFDWNQNPQNLLGTSFLLIPLIFSFIRFFIILSISAIINK